MHSPNPNTQRNESQDLWQHHALGIGANTAIFTLAQGILLRSLPVTDPSRLYRIGDRTHCCYFGSFESDDGDFDLFSYDLYRRFQQAAPEFEQLWRQSRPAAEGSAFARDISRATTFPRWVWALMPGGR